MKVHAVINPYNQMKWTHLLSLDCQHRKLHVRQYAVPVVPEPRKRLLAVFLNRRDNNPVPSDH